jgi:hypothetical protein
VRTSLGKRPSSNEDVLRMETSDVCDDDGVRRALNKSCAEADGDEGCAQLFPSCHVAAQDGAAEALICPCGCNGCWSCPPVASVNDGDDDDVGNRWR